MTLLIFPWEHGVESRCSAQGRGSACVSKAALLLQQHWVQFRMAHFGMASTPGLPASSVLWGCPAGSTCSGGKGWCAAASPRISWPLAGGYQFQGPSQGKQKMHQFHVDSGQRMDFPDLSLEEWNPSVMKNRAIAASLEMGVQLSKDFTWGLIVVPTIFYSALHPQRTDLI